MARWPARFKKLREHCNAEFTAHWTCLDSQNQMYQYCRREESKMNACVFEKLVRPAAFPVACGLPRAAV